MTNSPTIAYFSMEIALEAGMPTYSGGLGVLAGDTIRAAADANLPLVAVTLLHRKGYFYQRLDADGMQHEEPANWSVDDYLSEVPSRVTLNLEGRQLTVRAWRREVEGLTGGLVPVLFLDCDLPENSEEDRAITDLLYGGDARYRLRQEAVLGIGGVRLLRALGYEGIQRYHMNEGHSALLAVELLHVRLTEQNHDRPSQEDLAALRRMCVFTTHTPVPAGHDQFSLDLVRAVLDAPTVRTLEQVFGCREVLNMTSLALDASHYINGVARKHGEVSRKLFPMYRIDWITNGVHASSWVSPPWGRLFDAHVPGWREDNFSLRSALAIPGDAIVQTHREAKWQMLEFVNSTSNVGLHLDHFTIGFARRMTEYKRPDLLFSDLDRLKSLARKHGPIQIVCAGKAHPRDMRGKELIRAILSARDGLREQIPVAYLENYDLGMAKLMVAGVDIWLNTPQPPLEASGTSGMKAALNGVPSLSVLDGWWIEGCIDKVTGWSVSHGDDQADANHLYTRLDEAVLPCFYALNSDFVSVMRHAIALNGSYFNAQRMVQQYVVKAYFA